MLRFALRNATINKNQIPINIWNKCHRRTVHSAGSSKSGVGKLILILTPITVGGGVVTYAKYDNKFRQTLIDNVPGIDPVLKVIYQEEGNALTKVTKSIDSASQSIGNAKDTVTGFFGGSTKEEPAKIVPTKKIESVTKIQKDVPDVPSPPLHKPSPSQSVAAPKPQELSKESIATTATAPTTTLSAEITKAPLPKLPTSISEFEHAIDVATQIAVKEYTKAVNFLNTYNEDIKKVVDQAIEKSDLNAWNTLKNKTSARDTFVDTAELAALEARKHLEQLAASIEKIGKDHAPEIVEKIQRNIKNKFDQLNTCKDELYNAKDSAQLSEKYWRKVESARNYFVNEVEALFPGINLNDKKFNLSKDDIDLFILHAYSHVLTYQKELQNIYTHGETSLRRHIAALRGSDDENQNDIKTQVDFQLENEKNEINIENQRKISCIEINLKKQLSKQLKNQAEAHNDHLVDALQQKEIELRRVFNRELNEKLSIEQTAYKTQLASMFGKLKGMSAALKEIDEELKARADADRMVHQAQSLWSACQALWASVRSGDPNLSWHYQLRPLSNEVAAVSRAAEGDELVAVVLSGVPLLAINRGVYPENALRERFIKVEKLARRLALVPEKGASLPIYLLSYIQSVFILTPENPISKEELNNEPVDISKFDTYDVLNKARYWIDRGNLMQALKYMNLLDGAARKISSDWIKETRLLLETQQAANTIMTHAAASSLLFL